VLVRRLDGLVHPLRRVREEIVDLAHPRPP
jgi:hypothetical protein